MKTLLTALCLTLTLVPTAFANAGTLSGLEALELANILIKAGVQSQSSQSGAIINAGPVHCVGRNFQDMCMVDTIRKNGDVLRFEGNAASRAWSLLKKAGLDNTISGVADGTVGDSVIIASSVVCQTEPDSHDLICLIQPDKN